MFNINWIPTLTTEEPQKIIPGIFYPYKFVTDAKTHISFKSATPNIPCSGFMGWIDEGAIIKCLLEKYDAQELNVAKIYSEL